MLGSWAIWTLCEGLYNRDPATNGASGKAILAMIFVYYFFYDVSPPLSLPSLATLTDLPIPSTI